MSCLRTPSSGSRGVRRLIITWTSTWSIYVLRGTARFFRVRVRLWGKRDYRFANRRIPPSTHREFTSALGSKIGT